MSAASIALEVAEVKGQLVSAQTIHHTLQQVGLHGRHPRRKPLLKLAYKKACKQFAEDNMAKSMNYWNHVLWSDESNGAFPLHGTVRYGSLLGGFPLGTVPGTWYFFSTTSAEGPSEPYRYQNVTCKLYWSLIGRRESSLLRHWTCDTRPSSTALPARFKSAQPAKDRTQLLFKQTHIFASTTK